MSMDIGPSQWTLLIQMAKKQGEPYKVKEMIESDFFNLKELNKKIVKNFVMNKDGDKVTWNDIKIIKMDKTHPNIMFYKTSYKVEQFKEINVRNRSRVPLNLSGNDLKKLSPIAGISKAKKNDLISLCSMNVIPEVHWEFYRNLKVSNQVGEEECTI